MWKPDQLLLGLKVHMGGSWCRVMLLGLLNDYAGLVLLYVVGLCKLRFYLHLKIYMMWCHLAGLPLIDWSTWQKQPLPQGTMKDVLRCLLPPPSPFLYFFCFMFFQLSCFSKFCEKWGVILGKDSLNLDLVGMGVHLDSLSTNWFPLVVFGHYMGLI